MCELKRICSKKALFILLMIIVLNSLIFYISLPDNKEITLTGQELDEYIAQYPQFLHSVSEQGSSISVLSIYADDFSKNNINKTMLDYKNLSGISLENADNRALVVWSDYHLCDIIILGLMLIVVLSFKSEGSKGLTLLIRSTKNGRVSLYIQRIAVLLICSVAISFSLSLTTLITSAVTFDGVKLFSPIQSVSQFMKCPYEISILSYIISSILIKAFTVFSICVFVYFLMLVFKNSLFIAGIVIASAAEIILSLTIKETSSFNHLKFINLFTLLKTDIYFKEYLNLNFFTKPVYYLDGALMVTLTLVAIVFVCSLFISEKKYFVSKSSVSRYFYKIKAFMAKLLPTGSVFTFEARKLLINQAVLPAFIIFMFIVNNTLGAYEYVYSVDKNVERWYNTFKGEISEQMMADIQKELSGFDKNIAYYQGQIDAELSNAVPNKARIENLNTFLYENITQKEALTVVYNNVTSGLEYSLKNAIKIDNIKPFAWNFLLREDKNTVNTASLYILLFIIFASSGIFSYDKQNNMTSTIRTLYNGRTKTTVIKLLYIALISAVFAILVHRVQYNMIGEILQFENLSSPVQSLSFMREFPFLISIKGFIILLFIVRGISAVIISLLTAVISKYTPDRMLSLVAGVFILAVPSMLLTISSDNTFSLISLLGGLFIC